MKDNHINYIEFKAKNLNEIKTFYTQTFNWQFTDYGPTYTAFSNSGLNGGFMQSHEETGNGVLVVLYHSNLQEIKEKVIAAQGFISKDIFAFPGGKRFHFVDPAGNELAVWCEK